MSTFSKFFDEQVRYRTCNEICHSGPCLNNAIKNVYKFFFSNARQHFLLVIPSVVLKMRGLNARVLQDSLKYYLECVIFGTLTGLAVQWLICYMRYLFGEFGKYTLLFWPGFIGGAVIYISPKRVQRLHCQTTAQGALEGFLMRRKNVFSRLLADSRPLQTFGFMLCSALILYAKQKNCYRGFWLLQPNPVAARMEDFTVNMESLREEVDSKKACVHVGTCSLYLLKGVRSYLAIGLFFDVIKALISNAKSGEKLALGSLLTLKLDSTAFLVAYIGLYRWLNCWLNRRYPKTPERNHICASFASGSSYFLYPKLSLLSLSLVSAFISLWTIVEQQQTKLENHHKEHKYWKYIKATKPLYKIFHMFLLAHSIHVYSFRNRNSSALSTQMINVTTNSYARQVTKYLEMLDGYVP